MISMNLEESEEKLRIQEKEKRYSKMKMDELMEIAREKNIDTKGEKAILVKRLVDEAAGTQRTSDQILLEEAIMSWSSTDMKGYLSDMRKPQWGSKATMTERIMNHIDIDDAVEITREYTTFLEDSEDKACEENSGVQVGSDQARESGVDERKRKRDTARNHTAKGVVASGEDTDEMEGDEDWMEEDEVPKSSQGLQSRRHMKEIGDVVVTKVVLPTDKAPQAPPQDCTGQDIR